MNTSKDTDNGRVFKDLHQLLDLALSVIAFFILLNLFEKLKQVLLDQGVESVTWLQSMSVYFLHCCYLTEGYHELLEIHTIQFLDITSMLFFL